MRFLYAVFSGFRMRRVGVGDRRPGNSPASILMVGNDIGLFTAVPEPGAFGCLAVLGVALMGHCRRRGAPRRRKAR